jgi:N-acetylneuraminate synthase
MSFYIQDTPIGENHPPYIIAELSANHNGSIERAKLSLKAAKESGASAVKIQSYTADTMTIDSDLPDFLIKGGLWDGYTLYDLYKEAQTPFEWHEELFHFAKEINLTIFSSPFDETAVDMLEKLNAPAYKVASFEIVDLPLIKYIAATKKPLLMSTGMASEEEISEAISVASEEGCEQILLFHCISSYPAPIHNANLLQMLQLKERYNVEIGLSDHTMGNTAAIAAVSLGASAIEKHFTLSRAEKGPDSSFSMEPDELLDLVTQTNNAKASL